MERFGLFVFAGICFAVPLIKLRKIVHLQGGYVLPMFPLIVSEVLVDNQQLVPLVEIPGQGQVRNADSRSAEYKVLVESEAGTIALPADETCGIVPVQRGELLPQDEMSTAGIVGLFKFQSTDYHILDIEFLALRITQEADKVA